MTMKHKKNGQLVWGILLFCFTAASTGLLIFFKQKIQNHISIQDYLSYGEAGLLILIGCIHLFGIKNVIKRIKESKHASILSSMAFVFGLFSLFLLLVDVVMLQEIGNEIFAAHDNSGEWQIIFFNHAIHFLFSLIFIVQSFYKRKDRMDHEATQPALKNEVVFLTVQQIGIFTAITGLAFTSYLLHFQIPSDFVTGLLFISTLVLMIPYILITVYWFYTKRKEKPSDWYDEKQIHDISRAGLITMAATEFMMCVWFGLSITEVIESGSILLFPFYSFLSILFFSGITLYMNRYQ